MSHFLSWSQLEQANQRIAVLQHDLKKLEQQKANDSDNDSDDDDLDDREALLAEIAELEKQNKARQDKLDEYEKNKKWNIDNMFEVKEERTVVNPDAGKTSYTPTGFVAPKDVVVDDEKKLAAKPKEEEDTSKPAAAAVADSKPAAQKKEAPPVKHATATTIAKKPTVEPPKMEMGVIESYPEFTEKYADIIEQFMAIPDLEGSKAFLLKYGDILLQENASNYLLLASLEDEMNGYHEKMKRTARQSQIITNIAELAKTLNTHPGNVILPFFARLQQREHFEEFKLGVDAFTQKIVQRAVTKKQEMDAIQAQEEGGTALDSIPREQRLGPGGLDPLEVIETLPEDMVKAFETRNVDDLKAALMKLDPEQADYHMKRCVDSGLWVANADE